MRIAFSAYKSWSIKDSMTLRGEGARGVWKYGIQYMPKYARSTLLSRNNDDRNLKRRKDCEKEAKFTKIFHPVKVSDGSRYQHEFISYLNKAWSGYFGKILDYYCERQTN